MVSIANDGHIFQQYKQSMRIVYLFDFTIYLQYTIECWLQPVLNELVFTAIHLLL